MAVKAIRFIRKAQQFPNLWRKRLWSKAFNHPDPVHNAPTKEELGLLEDGPASSTSVLDLVSGA